MDTLADPKLLFSTVMSILAQAQQKGLAWWVWLIIIVLIILFFLLLWWWLRRPKEKENFSAEPPPSVIKSAEVSVPPVVQVTPVTPVPPAPVVTAPPTPVITTPPTPVIQAPPTPVVTTTPPPVVPPAERVGETPTAPTKPDDLTVIEGIGPKIASVLGAAGITTFAQLARADVSRLQQVLLDAGLRLADPGTWPEQAKLLAEGKWDEFKALTDSLKGGRRV